MQNIQAILATTRLDLHHERFAVTALRSMADQAQDHYIPMMVEHDIRRPTTGRIVTTEVVELGDGEYGLLATAELFDESDDLNSAAGDGRFLSIGESCTQTLHVTYDRMLPPEGKQLVRELSEVTGDKPEEEGKKALEPIAVLTISLGTSLAIEATKGAASKAGADAWDKLKEIRDILVKHFRQGTLGSSVVFDTMYLHETPTGPIEVHILLDKDVGRKIGKLFDEAFALAGSRLKKLPLEGAKVRRIVFEYDGSHLELRYAVREDCVPMTFVNNQPVLLLLDKSDRLKIGASSGGRASRKKTQ